MKAHYRSIIGSHRRWKRVRRGRESVASETRESGWWRVAVGEKEEAGEGKNGDIPMGRVFCYVEKKALAT